MWTKFCAKVRARKILICSMIAVLLVSGVIVAFCWQPSKTASAEPPEAIPDIAITDSETPNDTAEAERKAKEEAEKKAAEEEARKVEEERLRAEAERKAKEEAEKKAAEEAARKAEEERLRAETERKEAEEAARKAEEEQKAKEEAAEQSGEAGRDPLEEILKQTEGNLTQEQKDALAKNAATCRHCGRSKADGKHHRFVRDMNCPDCGVFVEVLTCHVCFE